MEKGWNLKKLVNFFNFVRDIFLKFLIFLTWLAFQIDLILSFWFMRDGESSESSTKFRFSTGSQKKAELSCRAPLSLAKSRPEILWNCLSC